MTQHLDHHTIREAMYGCASKYAGKAADWADRYSEVWADDLARWSGTEIAGVLDGWARDHEFKPRLSELCAVLGGLTRHTRLDPEGCHHCEGGVRQAYHWPRERDVNGIPTYPEREEAHTYALACDCDDGRRLSALHLDYQQAIRQWERTGDRFWIQDCDNPYLGGLDTLAVQDRERLERAPAPRLGQGRDLRPQLVEDLTYQGSL